MSGKQDFLPQKLQPLKHVSTFLYHSIGIKLYIFFHDNSKNKKKNAQCWLTLRSTCIVFCFWEAPDGAICNIFNYVCSSNLLEYSNPAKKSAPLNDFLKQFRSGPRGVGSGSRAGPWNKIFVWFDWTVSPLTHTPSDTNVKWHMKQGDYWWLFFCISFVFPGPGRVSTVISFDFWK